MPDDLNLAELLCARLCHDLAGPIAGAAAGVELIADEDGAAADGDDVRLLADSVATAAAHLKFLRAALGHGSAAMSEAELRGLAGGFLPQTGAYQLDWQSAGDGNDWPRPWAKLALNLLMIAQAVLPRGGRIAVRLQRDPLRLAVTATGTATDEEALKSLSAADSHALTPRGAQAYYAAQLAAAQGARIDVARLADGLVLTVAAPA